MALIEKLTNIADGFRTSRSLTQKLSLDEMAVLAAVPIGSAENKLAQLVNGTLTEVTAEDLQGVTDIVDYAFYRRTNLMKITIPNTVRSIGNESLFIKAGRQNGAIYIDGDLAFYCNGIEYNRNGGYPFCFENVYIQNAIGKYEQIEGDIVIPNSVTKISHAAFDSSNITSIIIPDSVNEIDTYAFFRSNLSSVTLPNTLTTLSHYVFYTCPNLTTINIPDSVESIGEYAFYQCSNLTNITIPSTITNIGYGALQIGSSTNKATITFLKTTPPTIASSTFNASYLEKIIVPAGSGEAYRTATNWANFADFIEEAVV